MKPSMQRSKEKVKELIASYAKYQRKLSALQKQQSEVLIELKRHISEKRLKGLKDEISKL